MVYDDPRKVVYGVDTLEGVNDESIKTQLYIPFDKKVKTDYLFWGPVGKNRSDASQNPDVELVN